MPQTIDTEFDQQANGRAQSIWRCPECGHEVAMTFDAICFVGPPLCKCGSGDDMDFINVVIKENQPSCDPIPDGIASLETLPVMGESEIRITVRGGNVQGIDSGSAVPAAIAVMVVDYDVDGMTADEIADECCRDEDGDHCIYRNA